MTVQSQENHVDITIQTARSPSTDSERDQLVALIRRWGGLTSDALLDPSCKFFSTPHIEGIIGYRIESNCAVVFGDPVCAPHDIPALTQAFHQNCLERGNSVIYLMSSETFARWAIQNICKSLVEFGEELYLDPHCHPMERHGTHASLVRRKVRHALKEGTTVKEYLSQDPQLEHAIEQVGMAWLQSRRGPQVHISRVYLFNDRLGKRWFYAQHGEEIIGVVVLNQLQAKQGWLLNHLMIKPHAPHGTQELLVISALEALQREGCHFVSFGAVPSSQLGEMIGVSKFSSWVSPLIFKMIYKIFHLSGLKMFWGKFHPEAERSYLLFSQSHIGFKEMRALMHAMNVSF
jgi:lysylphosphatidylglycerol synthetase-like protein (DUF2156 family)